MRYCMQFFFGLCSICLSAVWCLVFVSVYFLFTFFSGLCSVRPAVSPLLRWFCKCDQCYQAFSTVMTMMMHKRKGHVFCVFSFFCVCPHCAICFGKSFNVTSVIKHFQQLWLWKSILRWSMFLSILCIVEAAAVVSPLCYMLRRFWAPTPDLASESDQLYSHVHSQSRWRVYNSHVDRQSHWRVYPRTISMVLVQTRVNPPQMKSASIVKDFPPKILISKCVFYWLKHGAASKPCVSSCSSASKKAQNWGFEITNVRYGHQPAFCRHFNDGSNSCFQTTNWNAAQAG